MTKFDLQHDEIMQNLGKIPTKLLTKAIPRIAFEQVERSKIKVKKFVKRRRQGKNIGSECEIGISKECLQVNRKLR